MIDGELLSPSELLAELRHRALAYVVTSRLPPDLQCSPANRMFVDRAHRGQAISTLGGLDDDRLATVLPTHGFSDDAGELMRRDDREGLVRARLAQLIRGERQFMTDRGVMLPIQERAEILADSEASDGD